MSKKDDDTKIQEPSWVEELLKNGTIVLEAKTSWPKWSTTFLPTAATPLVPWDASRTAVPILCKLTS